MCFAQEKMHEGSAGEGKDGGGGEQAYLVLQRLHQRRVVLYVLRACFRE